MKNELGGSATQQELTSWGGWGVGMGSQWNEQGNWGLNPDPINLNPESSIRVRDHRIRALHAPLYWLHLPG